MRSHHYRDTVDLRMECKLFYCVCLTFYDFVHALVLEHDAFSV